MQEELYGAVVPTVAVSILAFGASRGFHSVLGLIMDSVLQVGVGATPEVIDAHIHQAPRAHPRATSLTKRRTMAE